MNKSSNKSLPSRIRGLVDYLVDFSIKDSLGEEIANGITHGVGIGLSIAGLIALLVIAVERGTTTHVVSYAIYGTSLILLYLASTLYHSILIPRVRDSLLIFDHACIYLLIAGTYTPFLVIAVGGGLGTIMMIVIWSIAAVGIFFKAVFVNRLHFVSTMAYIVMGWLAVFWWQELVTHLSPSGVAWLAAGGIIYTLGTLFFAMTRIPYNHAVWHLFVLGGSVCHFIAVLYTLPVV